MTLDFLKCPADQKDLNPDDNVYSECSVNYRSFFKSPLEQLKMTIAMLDQNQKVLLKKRADVDGYLRLFFVSCYRVYTYFMKKKSL